MTLCTESEARQRWCPYAKAMTALYDEDGNRGATLVNNRAEGGRPDRDAMCLGSECMAWRLHTPTLGYCGLAGRPVITEKE